MQNFTGYYSKYFSSLLALDLRVWDIVITCLYTIKHIFVQIFETKVTLIGKLGILEYREIAAFYSSMQGGNTIFTFMIVIRNPGAVIYSN